MSKGTIFTQYAYISEDVVIQEYELKVYYRTIGAEANSAVYGHAVKVIPNSHYSTFISMRVQGIKLDKANELDPGFTKISLECAAILTQKTFDDYGLSNFNDNPGWKIYQGMPKLLRPSVSSDGNVQASISVSFALRSLQNFLSFMRGRKLTNKEVPYLSLKTYRDLADILHEAGKLLIDKDRD